MTYISHPVRAMRDDPAPDESATLLLRLADDEEIDTVATRVTDLGGDVDTELEFETLRVVVPEPIVVDICELDAIDAIETDATIQIGGGDAGEDVELNDS